MPHRRLNLISRGHCLDDTCSSFMFLSTEQLWKKARDESLHSIFRESAMIELARRGESGLTDLCRSLLSSVDIDEWFSAVRVLRSAGTHHAADILLEQCESLDLTLRRTVLFELAHFLPPTRAEDFSELLRDTPIEGTVDVTGWTDVAFLSICDVAREESVRIMLTYCPSEELLIPAAEEEEGVHLSTVINT